MQSQSRATSHLLVKKKLEKPVLKLSKNVTIPVYHQVQKEDTNTLDGL